MRALQSWMPSDRIFCGGRGNLPYVNYARYQAWEKTECFAREWCTGLPQPIMREPYHLDCQCVDSLLQRNYEMGIRAAATGGETREQFRVRHKQVQREAVQAATTLLGNALMRTERILGKCRNMNPGIYGTSELNALWMLQNTMGSLVGCSDWLNISVACQLMLLGQVAMSGTLKNSGLGALLSSRLVSLLENSANGDQDAATKAEEVIHYCRQVRSANLRVAHCPC